MQEFKLIKATRFFLENPYQEVYLRELAKKLRISPFAIKKYTELLIREGLVSSVVKGKNKCFKAAEPKTIVDNLEYKKNKIKDILPQLEIVKHKEIQEKIKAEVYEGIKGIQTIFSMMLKEKEILALGGSGKTSQIMPYFMPKWNKQRKLKGVIVKMIYQDTSENRKRVQEVEKDLQPVKYKFLHTDYISPILTLIFGDKIMLGLFSEEPSATLINNKELAETYRQYFESLWKIAKK